MLPDRSVFIGQKLVENAKNISNNDPFFYREKIGQFSVLFLFFEKIIILVADRENVFSLRNKIEKAFQILDRYLYWFQTCSMQKNHFFKRELKLLHGV